ncbi:phosphoribosyltransferase [Cryobacterium sp. TMT2-10]|uniref:Phosphoribosyltransferase n=1 Tax=Cryobacterium shii TaxID=1259235 RepID=A0AAQ2C4X5_9MICO|nr:MULTISPECIES: phosphoribosyltransferase family protein [Cryobacterium]TFC43606.1 phosphoribosyltransferase [Cryobacterium shii]TFC85979.1 phosphoribosyltransferase [Cryobacterium sp. TmT2-59]TFD39861.1 phosphoribosyltransferase [Cryobacterium sp. TMT2-10]
MVVFTDRADAGRQLAEQLEYLRGQDVVVLGLPRGGVPVAAEVAETLDAPLDVIVVRKLGVPYQPELAMGAIGEHDVRVLNTPVLNLTRVTDEELADVEAVERAQLHDRVARFRKGRQRVDLTGRIALIVDDGIATGSTARVACLVARQLGAKKVILAVPVGPADTIHHFPGADEVVCLYVPAQLIAVGNHYYDFSPTSDSEVTVLLDAAAERMRRITTDTGDPDREVEIPADGVHLGGHLRLPAGATGVVLFAHGSGSSRYSPRNRFVAEVLNRAGLGTLLLDLLTPEEEPDRAKVFDIGLLANRLAAATRWLGTQPDTRTLRVGYFGASTGAGAALWAAADAALGTGTGTGTSTGTQVSAVVSRGGRPDLAGPRLAGVRAPTLLIVGGADTLVLELNRQARALLRCPSELAVVPGATHLFEERGTLGEAAALARDWFLEYLAPAGSETEQSPEARATGSTE